ncbi:hypothetical protein M422DRAFT_51506 [Sphaerobolus stellatus SS14]|uniref:Uncharacterized protein n=1 Tax=Sphaerobolus stellatus (strain SS14) TaxID=990650 RepID=A0A0C9VCZ2_SPHS4|nr:hypothetical protein M422DRAFT_51506 [Sphaerobolus stellatus SS14]
METGQKAKLLNSLLARHPKLKCLRLGSAVRTLEQSIEQPERVANLPGLPPLLSLDAQGDLRLNNIPMCIISESLECIILGAHFPVLIYLDPERLLSDILKQDTSSSLRTLGVPPEPLKVLTTLSAVFPLLERLYFIHLKGDLVQPFS